MFTWSLPIALFWFFFFFLVNRVTPPAQQKESNKVNPTFSQNASFSLESVNPVWVKFLHTRNFNYMHA